MQNTDNIIKDISLAEYGNLELKIAEKEMPGLMACREKYSKSKPFKGKRISGSLHMTIQTGVLIETLHALGATIRWCSCNIHSTQDHAAAAIVKNNTANVFAFKGLTLTEYWEMTLLALQFEDGKGPTSIVDDGGDMTMLLLEGMKAGELYEKERKLPDLSKYHGKETDERYLFELINREIQKNPRIFHDLSADVVGISEETTTGVLRLNQLSKKGELPFVAINVNDSVTKSKFDNIYGCRHSVIDGIYRATDVLISGKKVFVAGYGDVGKGCAQAFKSCNAVVYVSEVDPICALQACMEGFQVKKLESVVEECDIFVTATGNKDIIKYEHMLKMKHNAIVGNIGHFDNEIEMDKLLYNKEVKIVNVKPQTDIFELPNGRSIIVLAQGRLLNLGCATGHPSFVMSNSFTNQTLAQISLYEDSDKYEKGKVYVLPRHLDEEVARLHLGSLGAELTVLKDEQASYIGVTKEGPFKSTEYRY